MFAVVSNEIPHFLRTVAHVTSANIMGEAPLRELCVNPNWIVFRSSDDFKTDSFAEFTITNEEPFTMAYSLRTKLQLFRIFPQSYGIIRPFEKKTFKLYVTTDGWDRSLNEIVNHTLKILVENMRIPEIIRAPDDVTGDEMARVIFRNTKNCTPLARMYAKFVVVLEKETITLHDE